MNSQKRVMLLIDADNVSADVVDQAVAHVMAQHGAIHVRRAYCTAESALSNLQLFKRHSIRPIVNLSTGKNSTDISLAVDAIDLVLAERPDTVVIVSSDSDFAPLVIRLREKGCRVEGIGQQGKTGDDSKPVYDDFVDLTHHKARGGESPRAAPRAAPRKRAAPRRLDLDLDLDLNEPPEAAGARAPRPNARAVERASESVPAAAPPRAEPVAQRVAQSVARTPAPRRAKAPPAVAAESDPVLAAPPVAARSGRPGNAAGRSAEARQGAARNTRAAAPSPQLQQVPDDVARILAAVPDLSRGGKVELGIAAEQLRAEKLLAKSATSTRLFKKFPEHFALTPERQPNKVQYVGPRLA